MTQFQKPPKAANDIVRDAWLSSVLAADFFVLAGPAGDTLDCQWTAPTQREREEFEVLTPHQPDLMGKIFGTFDRRTSAFRLHSLDDVSIDRSWRGDRESVIQIGKDWIWDKTKGRLTLIELLDLPAPAAQKRAA